MSDAEIESIARAGDLATAAELKAALRKAVADAGGAKKWLKLHGLSRNNYVAHMYDNGDAATLPETLSVLGYRQVVRYEKT